VGGLVLALHDGESFHDVGYCISRSREACLEPR
jgi:hypothetical protein